MPRWLTRLALFAFTAMTVLGLGVARAQDPQLHEAIPNVDEDEASTLISSGGEQPEAIVYDGEVLPAPEGGPPRQDERPMSAQPGDSRAMEEAGQRSPTFRPDRITELNGTINYYTVFTPSIAFTTSIPLVTLPKTA